MTSESGSRESSLVHMLSLIVAADASEWWGQIVKRFHIVIFYTWFLQEIELLGKKCVISHVHF